MKTLITCSGLYFYFEIFQYMLYFYFEILENMLYFYFEISQYMLFFYFVVFSKHRKCLLFSAAADPPSTNPDVTK